VHWVKLHFGSGEREKACKIRPCPVAEVYLDFHVDKTSATTSYGKPLSLDTGLKLLAVAQRLIPYAWWSYGPPPNLCCLLMLRPHEDGRSYERIGYVELYNEDPCWIPHGREEPITIT
jgi:hypothetical protein